MEVHLVSYYIGIALIFLVNGFAILATKKIQYLPHINILAGLLIAYFFMNKIGAIKF